MNKLVTLSACLVMVGAGVARAELKSGLSKGERVPAYFVRDITGPSAGETLCYRCQFGNKPVVNVFARTIDKRLVSLIKQIDGQLAKNEKLKGFVTVITDDADKTGKELEKLAKQHRIKKLPLTVYEGKSGPAKYKIAKNADVTVMMWVNSQVKVNEAFAKNAMCSECVKAIVAEIPTILK